MVGEFSTGWVFLLFCLFGFFWWGFFEITVNTLYISKGFSHFILSVTEQEHARVTNWYFYFSNLSSNSLHKEQEHTWARVVSLQAFLASWNKKWNKLNWKGNTEHQLRGSKGKVSLELNFNTLKATQHQQLTCQYSFYHPNLFYCARNLKSNGTQWGVVEEEGLKKGHVPVAFESPFLQTMGFKGIWSHPEVPVPTLFPVFLPWGGCACSGCAEHKGRTDPPGKATTYYTGLASSVPHEALAQINPPCWLGEAGSGEQDRQQDYQSLCTCHKLKGKKWPSNTLTHFMEWVVLRSPHRHSWFFPYLRLCGHSTWFNLT